MKVAFSASYWKLPKVFKLLQTCDVIYTTNLEQIPNMKHVFGWDTNIQPMPAGLPGLTDYIKSTYLNTEFVTFSDIMKLVKDNYVWVGGPTGKYIDKETSEFTEKLRDILEV
jgi:hypothetical protein